MIFKIIFTWWNKQTLGTYLKTLFFGIYVGKDEYLRNYHVIRLASDIAPTNDEFKDGKVKFFKQERE